MMMSWEATSHAGNNKENERSPDVASIFLHGKAWYFVLGKQGNPARISGDKSCQVANNCSTKSLQTLLSVGID